MKTLISVFLVLVLMLTITACDLSRYIEPNGSGTEPSPTDATQQTTEVTVPATEAIETTAATEPVLSDKLPYKQKIKRADHPIYNGPGYDYNQVGTVEESGTYTIVDEQIDYEGNLWGKLKSGVGWVDLTQINDENNNPPLVTISRPDKSLLKSNNYHHCIVDTSEYMVQIALRVREPVSNVTLYEVIIDGDDEYLNQVYALVSWDADLPIVADVAFPGDFSMYEFHVTDAYRKLHRYTIYESGRNGDLELEAGSMLDE